MSIRFPIAMRGRQIWSVRLALGLLSVAASLPILSADVVYFKAPELIPIPITQIGGPVPFDINADGVVDLRFEFDGDSVLAFTPRVTRLITYDSPGTPASAASSILPGTAIELSIGDQALIWDVGQISFNSCGANGNGSFCSGDFLDGSDLMGVEFDISGGTHYGWIRMFTSESGFGWIDEWAYESDPGIGIAAGAIPEPSAGLLLMLGACGFVLVRRRRR